MADMMPSPPSSPRAANQDINGHSTSSTKISTTLSSIPEDNDKAPFDIVQTYLSLLNSDPDLTMPVAAIESLVQLLSHSPPSTISETLSLLASSTAHLKRSIPNSISLSAGSDLFQRYLITTLQRPGQLGPAGDFRAIRAHLLSNGRLFVKRAKESRRTIAGFGRRFVRDGGCVLTNGGSRVVGAVLMAAAEERDGGVRFKVVYVQSESGEGREIVRALREKGVPVATISEAAVAYAMGKVDMVMVGAEGVVENGGVISRMGTYQLGILAKSAGKPFYVMAETHKFVRLYPLGQYDLPVEQKVLDFTTDTEETPQQQKFPTGRTGVDTDAASEERRWTEKTPLVTEKAEYFDSSPPSHSPSKPIPTAAAAVDFTPPSLITALITESGVHTPSAVSEELIKLWY